MRRDSAIHFVRKYLSRNREKTALLVFGLLIAVFYGNTLFNGFILDDRPVIKDNIYIQSLDQLPKVITGCIWEHALGGCKGKTLHYRPIQSLSYILTWQISSSPWVFHLVNLLYFFAVVFLVFAVAKQLTRNLQIALFAALLFLAHPINSEVVNWVSAVSELTFAIFVLLTILFYAKYRQEDSWNNLIFALLFYFLAMLSKELAAVILPPIIISLDFLFFKKNVKELIAFKEIKKYLLFSIPFLVYWAMRQMVLGGFGGLASSKDYLGGYSAYDRIYYFLWLFSQYLEKLFYSYPLMFLHELKETPDLFSPRLSFFIVIFGVFLLLFYILARKEKKFPAFSLFSLFIFIFPSLIFYNIAGENIFAERYLFLPSTAFSFLIAYFLDSWLGTKKLPAFAGEHFKFLSKISTRKVFKSAVLLFLSAFLIVSWLIVFPRNKTWKDNETFLRENLALNPAAHPLRDYLANDLAERGDEDAAAQEYEEIVRRAPNWENIGRIYSHLGHYWRKKGELDKAQEYYEKAVQAGGEESYQGYSDLGAILIEKQDYIKAVLPLCKAVQLNPNAQEPQYNFQRAAAVIEGTRQEAYIFLYMQVMDRDIFIKSNEEKIKFKKTFCAYGDCVYIFSPNMEKGEVLLPFLTMVEAFPNELVMVKNATHRPETGEIVLSIDPAYQNRFVTFTFPTCDGIYYQAVAGPVSQ